MSTDTNPEQLAARVAAVMNADDKAAKLLGISLVEVRPGSAVLTMGVREDMLNGHGICHGGITFTLADTAFAYACNSRNVKTVALTCTINFIAPVAVGDVLTAAAREVSSSRKTGVYDISVTNQKGEPVAQLRGTSYATRTPVVST
ncbi:MAG: hydroxyphenylacetyl-CoA thioesterase PaaI [Candidatus Obscuribacterales bacterium]|nr:hydroxyphenylacetyl-CoA thioesterase PaaI [Candidatus Obscuribacterales bacterium]